MSVRNTGMTKTAEEAVQSHMLVFCDQPSEAAARRPDFAGKQFRICRTVFTDYGQRDEGFTDCDRCI